MLAKRLGVAGAMLTALYLTPASAQTPAAPPVPAANQAELDELARRTALTEARTKLMTAEISLAKLQFPLQDGDVGKTGVLTIETSDRDKFHVTARSVEAFQMAAKRLAVIVAASSKAVVILSEVDRVAMAQFRSERFALDSIERRRNGILGSPTAAPQGLGPSVLSISSALSQMAQFTQLFRSDISLSFTESSLPDTVFTDLLAVELKQNARYPAGELDSLFVDGKETAFSRSLNGVLTSRDALSKKGDDGKAILADIEALSARLSSTDIMTKMPVLFTVLRGELVANAVGAAPMSVTVNVVSKGGSSMKTSNIFRSDRLYAAGGLMVSYRLAKTGASSSLELAGVIVEESGFVRVNLKGD